MKIHRHLIIEIFKAIEDIFFQNGHADKVVERALKNNRKWGARDRRFFAENVYDMVRWWRKLWFLVDSEPSQNEEDLWKVLGVLWKLREKEIPNYKEFDFLKKTEIPKNLPRVIEHSIPDWLDALGSEQLGDQWELSLKELNKPADVILRTNTLKTKRESLIQALDREDIQTRVLDDYPEAVLLKERKNVFITDAYKKGLFEVQDANSQRVAPLLSPQPGMRVIDACAGAGGKALHLATLMENKGKIIALDIHSSKLEELQKRARRNGIHIIETRTVDSTKVVKRLEGSADRVLLDVPCTGLGVLRRNPDTKWKLSIDRVRELMEIQRDILDRYSRMTKVGGELVYSTCSILPSENDTIVEKFLESNTNWEKLEAHICFPHKTGYDGFFMARLRRVK